VEKYLSTGEVASRLGVTSKTIKNWIKSGTLPAPMRIGGILRFSEVELEKWIADLRKKWAPSLIRNDT